MNINIETVRNNPRYCSLSLLKKLYFSKKFYQKDQHPQIILINECTTKIHLYGDITNCSNQFDDCAVMRIVVSNIESLTDIVKNFFSITFHSNNFLIKNFFYT